MTSGLLWSHGGGLNKDGCHNERKTGGYHCHRSPAPNIQSIPQQNNFKSSVIFCMGKGFDKLIHKKNIDLGYNFRYLPNNKDLDYQISSNYSIQDQLNNSVFKAITASSLNAIKS